MKYVVVDLEMNPIRKRPEITKICRMETIEIGAVMLDENHQEISSLRTYVKPEYAETIAKNITHLTGITDDMVVNAPKFNEALNMFTSWCLGVKDDVTIYAWSTADFEQITHEMSIKNYLIKEEEKSLLSNEWSDFQHEFDSDLGFERQLSLSKALEMAGVDFSGREHTALDDARNTAELFKIFNDKELFNKTLSKIKEVMQPTNISNTLGDLFDFSAFNIAS